MDNNISQSPQLVVAGRFLTGQEEERWQRALRDPVSGLLRAILITLLGVFSIQAAGLSAESDWRMPSLVIPWIAVCLSCLLLYLQRFRRHRRQAGENKWLDRWQDSRMIRAGVMISLYDDHVAYSTMRGSSILRYTDVTRFCETADGIAIGNDHFFICFRGVDLTPPELVAIRRFLQEHITGSQYRGKAPAIPALSEPLPHVRFANYDTVITRAAVAPSADKREFLQGLWLVIPQLLIYSLTPALMTALTPWPLANCVIFGVVFGLVGVLIIYFSWVFKKENNEPIRLAFTKDGLAQQRAGVVTFTVHNRYRLLVGETGVSVLYTSGERLDVPWSAIEDPDALKNSLDLF